MLTEQANPDKIVVYHEHEPRQLRPVSEREQVLLNFIRNQLNRCRGDGCEVQVTLRVSEWGVNWRVVK